MTFDAREFRDALSSFATGVTIVTAWSQDAKAVGMTCSSFNSVSMDPPLVLWSVTKTARSAPTFISAQHFAVHVLAFDQSDISNRFARSGEDKFGATDHHFDENNVPIIHDTASRFDCEQYAVHEGGDHWIVLGGVLGFEHTDKEGLVFSRGSYAKLAPIPKE
jgi:3-hydroxy-9,10-secoandrosta-1,3,5(10)-triene-9,17-dione monooxygenase reductase component